MTDEPAEPAAPEPAPTDAMPERARVQPSARRRGWDALPVLYLVGFVVLAGALFYLWRHPQKAPNLAQATVQVGTLQQQVAALNSRVEQMQARPAGGAAPDVGPLQQQLTALAGRVEQLEKRPAPGGAADVGALQQQVSALAKQMADLAARPAPATVGDFGQMQGQLAEMQRQIAAVSVGMNTLATRPPEPPELGPLTARVNALEAKPQVDLGPLNTKIADLEGHDRDALAQVNASLQSLGKQEQALEAGIAALQKAQGETAGSVQALGKTQEETANRVAAAEAQGKQSAAALAAVTQRAQEATRLQAAATALATGQKLGAIPGAPPALARFATDAPPTEASLRLSFDHYADAAQKASSPAPDENVPFGTRLWQRAQQVVTVRQGDRVMVGDPITGVLAHARADLDAGDLRGALATLGALTGPPAQAMAPWLDQAHALLDARAALATMAAG